MSSVDAKTVAVSGATGLVGTALSTVLRASGHTVRSLSRKTGPADCILWDPDKGLENPKQLENVDTIVHLAGENIAGGRWTPAMKERMRSSRVDGTRNLVKSLASIQTRPKTLVCASAIGFYGDRGTDILTEASAAGSGTRQRSDHHPNSPEPERGRAGAGRDDAGQHEQTAQGVAVEESWHPGDPDPGVGQTCCDVLHGPIERRVAAATG